MTQQNRFVRFAYGVEAGINAGNTNALFIDMTDKELLAWTGDSKPDMDSPALKNALALRTYLRREVGNYVVEAVALVIGENNSIEFSAQMINAGINAASKIFVAENRNGLEFAGSSFKDKGAKLITAVRYSGQLENVAAIDFAVLDNGTSKLFMLTTDGAKVFDLATKKWAGILIDGISATELAEITGVTRFVSIGGTDGANYLTTFTKRSGEQIAIELIRNTRGIYELKAVGRFNFAKENENPGEDTIVELVGPITGTIDQIGGFNANGQVVRLDRTAFTTRLEDVRAPKQLIVAYAPPGYGI